MSDTPLRLSPDGPGDGFAPDDRLQRWRAAQGLDQPPAQRPTPAPDAPQAPEVIHDPKLQAADRLARLAQTREASLKQAEVDRAARLAQAEADRTRRLKQFEEDKQKRIEEAARKRAADLEEAERTRRDAARARLSTLEDLDTARARLRRARAWANARLGLRFCALVLAPTALAAWFALAVAPPVYTAQTLVAVRAVATHEGAATPPQGPFQTAQASRDSFVVRAFLTSPDLMRRLAARDDSLAALTPAHGGLLNWLGALAHAPEDPMDHYRQHVRVGLDMQEDLLRLEVDGAQAEDAERLSHWLLAQAEAHLNGLSAAQYDRQLADLGGEVVRAASDLHAARQRLVTLQNATGEVDPSAKVAAIYRLLADLERDRANEKQSMEALIARGSDQTAVLRHKSREIALIDAAIDEQRALLVAAEAGGTGVNTLLAEFEYARTDIDLAHRTWVEKTRAMEALRVQIAGAERVLAIVSGPHSGARAAAPRPVHDTATVFALSLASFAALSVFGASLTMHARR